MNVPNPTPSYAWTYDHWAYIQDRPGGRGEKYCEGDIGFLPPTPPPPPVVSAPLLQASVSTPCAAGAEFQGGMK